jgi:hypothetical protein
MSKKRSFLCSTSIRNQDIVCALLNEHELSVEYEAGLILFEGSKCRTAFDALYVRYCQKIHCRLPCRSSSVHEAYYHDNTPTTGNGHEKVRLTDIANLRVGAHRTLTDVHHGLHVGIAPTQPVDQGERSIVIAWHTEYKLKL